MTRTNPPSPSLLKVSSHAFAKKPGIELKMTPRHQPTFFQLTLMPTKGSPSIHTQLTLPRPHPSNEHVLQTTKSAPVPIVAEKGTTYPNASHTAVRMKAIIPIGGEDRGTSTFPWINAGDPTMCPPHPTPCTIDFPLLRMQLPSP